LKKYDPNVGPSETEWLEIPEVDRFEMVTAYHRRRRISLPNHRLHAVIHVVVENQIALGEEVVVEALDRLQNEGLSRHDAIHAIGSVLGEHLYEVLKSGGEPTPELHAPYFDRLRHFSAEDWRRSG
jgi:Domain of unknown function (DUF1841)